MVRFIFLPGLFLPIRYTHAKSDPAGIDDLAGVGGEPSHWWFDAGEIWIRCSVLASSASIPSSWRVSFIPQGVSSCSEPNRRKGEIVGTRKKGVRDLGYSGFFCDFLRFMGLIWDS